MKYAPAREDGLKPYLVEQFYWGRRTEHIVYASDARDAEWRVKGRMRYVSASARRATPDDVARVESLRGTSETAEPSVTEPGLSGSAGSGT